MDTSITNWTASPIGRRRQFGKSGGDKGEYRFRHCVVASTWAFEAQGPGSIPGGGAIYMAANKNCGAIRR